MVARKLGAGAVLVPLALLAFPAAGQDGAIGPCSPYRSAEGDIPSEMPGCGRRLRPAPGSLADELDFRRARNPGHAAEPDDDEPSPAPRRHRAGRPRAR
ncbi:hypothetical protein D3273_11075 [Lichenibacterium minor]|uniref:Uncharacterized protein n=1 Tax=Lichenibacterium minor TaxID=2316528 RepID=A0A4Q2U6K2_9HYPH|nr:hypothetical protein [Lichenibacterium minor]RYC31960.1 hypothetical protein D3273_11075 [Lichenibacterium minor]